MAKVNIIRPKRILAFAISFKPSIDDNEIGVLKNGTTLTTELAPGKHVLSFKSIENTVNVDITINDDTNEVNITVIPGMGLLVAQPTIKDIEYK